MKTLIWRLIVVVVSALNAGAAVMHWMEGNTIVGNTFFIIAMLFIVVNYLEMIYDKVRPAR